MAVQRERSALIVVDVQLDFCEGGALALSRLEGDGAFIVDSGRSE